MISMGKLISKVMVKLVTDEWGGSVLLGMALTAHQVPIVNGRHGNRISGNLPSVSTWYV